MRRSAPNIALDLEPSRALRIGIVAAGALAVVGVALSGLGVSFSYVVAALAGLLVLRAWRMSGLHAGSRLALMPDGNWTLRTPGRDDRNFELRAASDLSFLVALTLGNGRQRVRLPIVADTIDADTMRQLRVWLRDAHAIGGFQSED